MKNEFIVYFIVLNINLLNLSPINTIFLKDIKNLIVSNSYTEVKFNLGKSKKVKIKDNFNHNKIIFENLDKILSPFEDMTEFALEKNEVGILKSLDRIEKDIKNSVFEKNISAKNIKEFNSKLGKLKKFIKEKNYIQIALFSTEIFKFNVINFIDNLKIENQINLEHLDYMGFKVIALSNQDKIDWEIIEQTISDAQKKWITLSTKVNDNNLKDSFNYLFRGLYLSVKNRDIEMSKILASMDLRLVDILESSINKQ